MKRQARRKTTAMVVAAGMQAEADASQKMLARNSEPEILAQSSGLTKETAGLLEIGVKAEAQIGKLERKAIPFILVAGAAFHLAKSKVEHGQWENHVTAVTGLKIRRVQQRMEAVNGALMMLSLDTDQRSYETIVFSSKIAKTQRRCAFEAPTLEPKFTKEFISRLAAALKGKSDYQLQLELGIRKPKKPLLPPAPDEEETPKQRDERVQREIAEAFQNFQQDLAELQQRAEFVNDGTRAAVGYHCARHLQAMLPKGWTFHIHAHTGKELSIEQVFVEHLGLPKEGE